MLPIQLLRARIKNRGKNIDPIFCRHVIDYDNIADGHNNSPVDIHLAAKLIEEFEESWKNKERNGMLAERIAMLEEQYGDYKLVRGLYTLLQRRCVFGSKKTTAVEGTKRGIESSVMNNITKQNIHSPNYQVIDPFYIRRELFEESSKRGYALTDFERTEIIDTVAKRLGISRVSLLEDMWSDLDENLIIEHFFKITAEELIGWYNLSLFQTLLFNCTQLEFSVMGGSNWKRVLRDVKRLGLMYNLEQRQWQHAASTEQKEIASAAQIQRVGNVLSKAIDDSAIICSVNGPLSIFKLTDRYGTAIAKLLPSIISTNRWFIKASIVRNNLASGKKIYEFEISNDKSPLLLREPVRNIHNINSFNAESVTSKTDIASITSYDSKVEEDFARRFTQSVKGWKLIREPDPIILSNGKALIPDFMFEKYGKRIYLEIVGFWTMEYLEKKLDKLVDISGLDTSYGMDFLVAINTDYFAASSNSSGKKANLGISKLNRFIEKKHLIMYKNDSVPLRPILEYLNSTEQTIEQELARQHSDTFLAELNHIVTTIDTLNSIIISIQEMAKKCDIPIEAALRIIREHDVLQQNKGNDKSHDKEVHTKFIIVDNYLVLGSKLNELKSLLDRTKTFMEASMSLKKTGIPEEIHIELISKLGFNVIWRGIDPNTAIIERKHP